MLRRPVTVGVSALLLLASPVGAQTPPAGHWGALMYPDTEPTQRLGFGILAFTQFGKDTNPDGTPVLRDPCLAARDGDLSVHCGDPDPYNDIDETIGLNIASYSSTRPLLRFKSNGSNLLYTHLLTVGWVNDFITETYQNRAIHAVADLQEIPRGEKACTDDFEWGSPSCYVLGYSGALNYHFQSFDSHRDGRVVRPTPLFVGAGFAVSTVYNEAYAQMGVRRFDLSSPLWPDAARVVYLSVSAMTRLGAAYRGLVFDHVASHYASAQAGIGLHFARYHWPVHLELGVSGSSGLFQASRRPKVGDVEDERPQPSTALEEQFWDLRLEIGAFTFETFNDQLGGKDKGPSYGAMISYTIVPDQNRMSPLAEFRDAWEFLK